jgi:hypothetical protein
MSLLDQLHVPLTTYCRRTPPGKFVALTTLGSGWISVSRCTHAKDKTEQVAYNNRVATGDETFRILGLYKVCPQLFVFVQVISA